MSSKLQNNYEFIQPRGRGKEERFFRVIATVLGHIRAISGGIGHKGYINDELGRVRDIVCSTSTKSRKRYNKLI